MSKKILFFLCFFLFFINKTNANTNIFYIDFEYLINNSEYSKIVFQKLDNQINESYANLDKEEKKLREEDENLTKKKNILSSEDFQIEFKTLSTKINRFNQKKQKISSDLSSLK